MSVKVTSLFFCGEKEVAECLFRSWLSLNMCTALYCFLQDKGIFDLHYMYVCMIRLFITISTWFMKMHIRHDVSLRDIWRSIISEDHSGRCWYLSWISLTRCKLWDRFSHSTQRSSTAHSMFRAVSLVPLDVPSALLTQVPMQTNNSTVIVCIHRCI